MVEVDGVEGQIQVLPPTDPSTKSGSKSTADRKRKRPSRSGDDQIRRGQYGRSDAASGGIPTEDEPVLPTAADLAASFLQAEPAEEKAQLEREIMSESVDLGASTASEYDDDPAVGTGTSLSLPAFMTNFLKGIVDRLQVRIQGITVDLEVNVANDLPGRNSPPNSDSVTVQLKIDDIDVEGMTTASSTEETSGPSSSRKEGKRLVQLRNLRGALISEASVFAALARSSSLSSPSVTHSDLTDIRRGSSGLSPPKTGPKSPYPGASSASSKERIFGEDSELRSPQPTFSSTLPKGVESSQILQRRDDEEDDDDPPDFSEMGQESPLGSGILDNSLYLDQLTRSQMEEDDEDEDEMPLAFAPQGSKLMASVRSPAGTPKASMYMSTTSSNSPSVYSSVFGLSNRPPGPKAGSAMLPPRFGHLESRINKSQPLPSLRSLEKSLPILNDDSRSTDARKPSLSSNDDDPSSNRTDPQPEDDLAQSRLFSHEDAESMYMSAISEATPSHRVPGGWDDWDDESSSLQTPKTALRASHDNLKHAKEEIAVGRTGSDATPPGGSQNLPRSSTSQQKRVESNPSRSGSIDQANAAASASENSSASSREYNKLLKQIFDIDQVSLWLPDTEAADEEQVLESAAFSGNSARHSNNSASVYHEVPGAFSAYSSRRPPVSQSPKSPPKATSTSKKSVDRSVEVLIGQTNIRFDVSIGRILFNLITGILNALKKQDSEIEPTKAGPAPSVDTTMKLRMERISIKFLERLMGKFVTEETDIQPREWTKPPDADVLLRTTFKGLDVRLQASQALTKTSITLQKFVFGYAKENIISFDAGLRMRSSVRDLSDAAGLDLSVNITQQSGETRVSIDTLPLHISIDLQRLDETFSWFGGLSSVLNMGSSMASTATVTPITSPTITTKPGRVHFDAPIKPSDKSMAAQNKVDLRLGGFVLDLVGKDCSVSIDTTAVKVISRDEGIGAAVDKIRVYGPLLRRSHDDPAVTAEITGARIEYLQTPKNTDLDRLLSLITPSKAKYDQDDDLILDTLLRQRRQGSVIRVNIDGVTSRVGRLDELRHLPALAEELSRLATVTKYLPDDDRPGLLALVVVRQLNVKVDFNNALGSLRLTTTNFEVAQITLPALVALSVDAITLHRNDTEELIGAATDVDLHDPNIRSPALMARMIGNEMEPVIKLKLWNLRAEYRVPMLMALMSLSEETAAEDMNASIATSVATLTGKIRSAAHANQQTGQSDSRTPAAKPLTIDLMLRDCIIGLNPLNMPSKILVVMTETHVSTVLPHEGKTTATANMKKGSILIVDDAAGVSTGSVPNRPRRTSFDGGSRQVADLCSMGYVSVSYISSAKATIKINDSDSEEDKCVDVELRDDLLVLESCADSTQTLVATLNGLAPPTPPSKATKYRTEVVPVEDLLASLSGEAFTTAEGEYDFDVDFGGDLGSEIEGSAADDEANELDFDSHYYQDEPGPSRRRGDDDESPSASFMSERSRITIHDTKDGVLLDSFVESEPQASMDEELHFDEDHFGTGSIVEGTAHRWNSSKNTYDKSAGPKLKKSPLKVCIRDVHVIWNLFDGYDWQNTRDVITKAVHDVEAKAIEKRNRHNPRSPFEVDVEEEETVIGDFLFNSIYIGIPANRDPRELAQAINQELNDNATETESVATTTYSTSTARPGGGAPRTRSKRLRLQRSKHHKITFELKGINVDLVTFPPNSGETQSSIDVRVHDFDIFDHVPTSTWKKFATYMHDAGERESGASQIHIEILTVKPVPDLAASEIVMKVTVLPLRLHVDQDALDFITRFFEFKDSSAPAQAANGDPPFLQRVEVNSIPVKLDFKPKRVDYAGLRSGHTTEFMNFLILDEADMVLRHTIIYGTSGFEKLGKTLNDVWMPDVKRNQLPGILAGLAPVRSLVNVGGGVRDLVVVPMREYRKDGRIVRSIAKGAAAFGKTTGTELVKLGAKIAVSTQGVAKTAEEFLTSRPSTSGAESDSDEEQKAISLYSNQPAGLRQGVKSAVSGIARDLATTRNAIIAISGEVMESQSVKGVAGAVARGAPTVVLTPVGAVAGGVGQLLMGAVNQLDRGNQRRIDDVSRLDGVFLMVTLMLTMCAEIQEALSLRSSVGLGW